MREEGIRTKYNSSYIGGLSLKQFIINAVHAVCPLPRGTAVCGMCSVSKKNYRLTCIEGDSTHSFEGWKYIRTSGQRFIKIAKR